MSTEYTGTLMSDLIRLVEHSQLPEGERLAERMLKRDPYEVLCRAKTRLTEDIMEYDEGTAWWIMTVLQQLLVDEGLAKDPRPDFARCLAQRMGE